MLEIRKVRFQDFPEVVEIENVCFKKGEAATEQALKERINNIPDSFFVAEWDKKLIGFINGPVTNQQYITDDLFLHVDKNPSTGGHQTILGLAVLPEYRKRGIGSKLLSHILKKAKEQKRKTITLTCKEMYIPFYEKNGFQNAGESESQLGGVLWYNMIKKIE